MTSLASLQKELKNFASHGKAKILAGFFKTGPGQYGEGDIFWGISVPQSRSTAIKYKDLALPQIEKLLKSKIHEERLVALLILVGQFERADEAQRKTIFDFYLACARFVNNWDLVDLSAPKIVGEYLLGQEIASSAASPRNDILVRLAHSSNLWERRIAIVATYQFITSNRFDKTLEIAKILLPDRHDLIHKAIGWMLREIGKRNRQTLENFLKQNYKNIPRTTLRHAIERFDKKLKGSYLSAKIPA